ncbi:MAG: response regulator [Bacteroidota bacterium]
MKKILVIEDDTSILENLSTLFEMEGYSVLCSENGSGAIEMLKTDLPDLVLCDITLPDMDGYAILKSVRSSEASKYLPFVFLTARSDMQNLREGMNLGADDYLIKPYDSRELLNVIKMRIELRNKPALLQTGAEDKDTTDTAGKNDENYTAGEINDGGAGRESEKYSPDDYIFIQTQRQVIKIIIKSIVCITADADYSHIFTDNGKRIYVRKLIGVWENSLPESMFLRIHKSFIINLSCVRKIEKWFNSSFRIYLNNYPEPVISSRRYSARLRSKFLG